MTYDYERRSAILLGFNLGFWAATVLAIAIIKLT